MFLFLLKKKSIYTFFDKRSYQTGTMMSEFQISQTSEFNKNTCTLMLFTANTKHVLNHCITLNLKYIAQYILL